MTASVGKYLLILVAVIFVAGNLIWFFTRRHADEPHGYVRGVGHGIFKATAVGLAGDFGTGDARRAVGRFVSIVWVIVGICFVSLFTATVTTQLTVQQIKSDIGSTSDLVGQRVLTVKGTTAAQYLTNHQLALTTVDAIVFDAPVLQHRASITGSSRETIVGGIFPREDYGIALPTGSALRKKINETLLALRADGTYDRLYEHHFGGST